MATLTSKLILALVDRVTAPARGAQGAMARLNDQIEANKRAVRAARNDMIGAGATAAAFGLALLGPVRSAMELESAMADVRKVTDFSEEGLEAFKGQLQELSTIPGFPAATELAALAAAAAQAGIASGDLLTFTERAAMIGTAFDISADDAGSALAKLMTSMDMTIDEVVLLSDAMNHLSNTQASSASEILDVVRRVGAQATQFGFNATQVSAFASAMIAAGAQSEVAATSFRNMGSALTRGSSATARQSDALAKLGLDAEEVARAMQDDAAGTVLDVLDKIGQMPEEMRAAISTDLFGAEARALGPLITNTDLLRQSLGLVGDESEYAGSAMDEFANRSATFEARWTAFRASLTRLSTEIGEALLPALTNLMDRLQPVVSAFADWADENPDTVETLVKITAALVSLRLAVTTGKFLMLIGQGGILMMTARGLSAVVAAAGGFATVASMAGALGKLATSAGKLGALGGLGAILTPNRMGDGTAPPDDFQGYTDDELFGHGDPGTGPLKASPMSYRPGWIAPPSSGGGASGGGGQTVNVNGNVILPNVREPRDFIRELDSELAALTNSQFSDGALA